LSKDNVDLPKVGCWNWKPD